ncbi:MAG: periplasmic heavy metal sensor [bacterium]|nr:periplasmic heavy metal sensor [bacterium]
MKNTGTGKSSVGWIIVVLVTLNLVLLFSIWYPRLKSPVEKAQTKRTKQPPQTLQTSQGTPPHGQKGRRPLREKADRKARSERLGHFLKNELDWNEAQVAQFIQLRDKHFDETDQVRYQMDELRKKMMDRLLDPEPDTQKMEEEANVLGQKIASQEKAVFNHFLQLMEICTPSQKKKYRLLMRDILEQMKPPRPPGGPGGNHPPGREGGGRNVHPQGPPQRNRTNNQQEFALEGTPENHRSENHRPEGRGHRPDMTPNTGNTAGEPRNQRPDGPARGNQGPQGPQGNMQHRMQRLQQALELSDSQVSQIQPLMQAAHEKLENLHSSSQYTAHHQRKEAADRIHKEMDQKIEALLTDRQKQLYRQIKNERPQNRLPPR